VLDDDEGFHVRRNGRDAGHAVFRARMHQIEANGCQYHSCPNGARVAFWSGTTNHNKYDAYGELLTIDEVSRYTEILTGGKTGRTLRSEEHLCRRVSGPAGICKGGPACDKPPLRRACEDPESGLEFPKGYQCVGEDKIGWQCEGGGGREKFYKAKGGGGKRKQDAICE
jgi:hypothetical protein